MRQACVANHHCFIVANAYEHVNMWHVMLYISSVGRYGPIRGRKIILVALLTCNGTFYRPLSVHVPFRSDVTFSFYTPVWKTGRIMPWQCPSVRLSVCPSVRPRFPDFSSTCFEISIWNLVYTFSRWHDMSSLSCIAIGSLWPSLQPKIGQTYFLQSWPHKSR